MIRYAVLRCGVLLCDVLCCTVVCYGVLRRKVEQSHQLDQGVSPVAFPCGTVSILCARVFAHVWQGNIKEKRKVRPLC